MNQNDQVDQEVAELVREEQSKIRAKMEASARRLPPIAKEVALQKTILKEGAPNDR